MTLTLLGVVGGLLSFGIAWLAFAWLVSVLPKADPFFAEFAEGTAPLAVLSVAAAIILAYVGVLIGAPGFPF